MPLKVLVAHCSGVTYKNFVLGTTQDKSAKTLFRSLSPCLELIVFAQIGSAFKWSEIEKNAT